ncbi:hypothetical protein MS2017_0966 [Bathymodiolus thermophilus thioautotrophic gill symbiont]|uniref:Peptidase M10 metallopeptidase domain-containing protein n=1 Tax=Bathymodiolus thermophilus thioautotrophic gill symbiont TaxID=2360 RepID=A0A3G3ILL3_9GAMM|nr:hypothetical protein [Bathymodiolus thermophilus thioautotrophic gill symbiont]AYQ56685.1 hypothetical protein MS2017_0966 [Bathymodiolus thermophilus thioautotrophic gill symbiont]
MNKKILLLCISFFCLASTNAYSKFADLSRITPTIGKQSINLWFWKIASTIDDQDDIENNLLDTISSVDPNVKIYVHWFDSNDEYYWFFYNANRKNDIPSFQLRLFRNYVQSSYYLNAVGHNDYHILVAEDKWGDYSGVAYLRGHFSLSSDDNEKIAAHVMGHMLNAQHNYDTSWFSASIMYPHPSYWLYTLQTKFWNSDNQHSVGRTLKKLKHFPDSKLIDIEYLGDDSTKNAKKYNGLKWDESRANIHKLLVEKNTIYDITIIQADFDTYLYVYDKDGNLLDKNDDGGPGSWSKLEHQDFGSAKEVYLVVSGYKRASGEYKIRLTDYKTLIIEDSDTLSSLGENNNLRNFINLNNKVWIKVHNGIWVGEITLPQRFLGKKRKVTLTVDSKWPVKVIFTVNRIKKSRIVSQGEEITWVNTGDGWLIK